METNMPVEAEFAVKDDGLIRSNKEAERYCS